MTPSRRDQLVPAAKRNERRQIDPVIVEPRDEAFEPGAALGKRPLAQILLAIGQQIVGAQMRRKFRHQLGRDGFAVKPLLQHVEHLHPAVAHDQEFAVDRARQAQRLKEIGKTFRYFLAGARIKPGNKPAVGFAVSAGHRLNANTVPFPLGRKVGRIERHEVGIVERMRQHRRPERRRIAADRLVGAALQPGE
jgi:hypothetical protein